jgi:Lon protease-like protein
MADTVELGLFPLGIALLPGERVPLHIFEPRYRRLVADCTLEQTPFVLLLETSSGTARVGCTARFETLLRRFADGRMNLVAAGIEPVEIVEPTRGRRYRTARVRPLPDAPSAPHPALRDEVLALFRDLAARVTGAPRGPEVPEGVPLSYAVAAALDLAPEAKQDLLERREEADRLARVRDVVELAQAGVDRARMAAARAQRNGKLSAP